MSQLPLVCLIHGHGVDASVWEGVYAGLALDNPVLKPDFSRLTHLSTIDAYADALYGYVQQTGAEKVILVGHSMGGYMALAFADKYPRMVQGLVLYHSTVTADDDDRKAARKQTIEELKTQGTKPFIQKQLPKMVAPAFSTEQTKALVERFSLLPADALIAGTKAIAGRPDRTSLLKNAPFPILLVLGREDKLIPYEKTAQLAYLSDSVSLATIGEAGHLSMIEQTDESIRVLRSFIKQG